MRILSIATCVGLVIVTAGCLPATDDVMDKAWERSVNYQVAIHTGAEFDWDTGKVVDLDAPPEELLVAAEQTLCERFTWATEDPQSLEWAVRDLLRNAADSRRDEALAAIAQEPVAPEGYEAAVEEVTGLVDAEFPLETDLDPESAEWDPFWDGRAALYDELFQDLYPEYSDHRALLREHNAQFWAEMDRLEAEVYTDAYVNAAIDKFAGECDVDIPRSMKVPTIEELGLTPGD